MHHRVTRTARARRRSGGQKRPSGAFLERGRVPDGAPRKAATNVAAFLLHHSLRDGLALRASARVRLEMCIRDSPSIADPPNRFNRVDPEFLEFCTDIFYRLVKLFPNFIS